MSVLFLGERREQVGRAEAAQLLQFKVQRGGFQRLGGIQKKISEMLNVQVDAFEDEANRGSDRTAEMDVDNFLLEVNGSGIKEALRLILDVEMKSPTLLLVEEPEIHLHPALENNMMRYLREVSAGCQVFITTHSTNFLDSPTTDNVYLISKTDKKTSARLLSVGEAEETLPEELGIRLSSLFLFDRLIFVEGVSDEQVIREFAATIGVNLTKANVGFIHMGGSRNFAYFASQATLDFLGRRQVKSFFVIDRDERTDADVQALKTMLQEKAVVHVLKRRELENYLLLVRPMTELVNWKLSQHGSGKQVTTVEEKNVQETLMKIVETYKPLVVAKRSAKRLLQPFPSSLDWPEGLSLEQGQKLLSDELERVRVAIDEKSKTVGGVFEETKKNVEGIWKNSLWEIVPGDELIDSVFRQFGARFKKVNDSPRLARSLRQDEIGAEIVTLLNSFVS